MKKARITIRLDEKDLIDIERMANKYGMDSSKYIRFCVQSTIKHDSIPKSEVVKLLHLLLSNSDFVKNKKLCNRVKELYDRWK